MSLKSVQQASDKLSEKTIKGMQRTLVNNYKATNKEFKLIFAEIYSKYETKGVLTYAEMQRFDRIKKLQKELKVSVDALYNKDQRLLIARLNDMYKNGYYTTAFAIEKEVQAKLSYKLLDPEKIRLAIQNPVSGLTLNQTLLKNKTNIIWKINQEMTQGLVKGESYQKMARRMTDALGGDAKKATVIARTEGHRIHNTARYESAQHADDLGVKTEKEWVANLDARTRDAHGILDGKTIGMKENFVSQAGGSGLFPGEMGNAADDINCRCDYVVVVAGIRPDFRRVRGEGVVPQITYKQWAKDKGVT